VAPIRVLVVDDSVVIRKLLTTTLGEVAGLEVVATAALGKIALAKIPQCHPDVVILDLEMPEMDGIETLRRIRKDAPRLPVIMFSTRTERGAAATIDALTAGASDYVAKPSNVGSVLLAMARVREELVPKIIALTAGRTGAVPDLPPNPFVTARLAAPLAPRPPAVATATAPTSPLALIGGARPTSQPMARSRTTDNPLVLDGPIRLRPPGGPRPPVEIVAIGASTGGPNALAVMLAQIPAAFPVPIVIVQHMLASFTRHFADRLAAQCQIKIVEASPGELLAPGCAYIARGDYHLVVERKAGRAQLAINQDPLENFCRPAVDVLFRSVAHCYGAGALALVLTGMGHDGLHGSIAIREAGGDVIVQDEASSVVWGMPGFIARAGLASQVLALDQISGELRRRVVPGVPRALEAMP